MNIGIGVGFTYIVDILGKLVIHVITVIFGISVCPIFTIVIGKMGGVACGYLGSKIVNKLSDKVFGKDEFVLKSEHLYYKYIPLKYRKKNIVIQI